MHEPVDGTMPEVIIVGLASGTHIGGSLLRAAERLGCRASLVDLTSAYDGPALLRSLSWRLAGRRPLHLDRFARALTGTALALGSSQRVVVATGAAPITRPALQRLRAAGIRCVNFSTDDPWNRTQRSSWHLRALPEYDVVFTPRRANIDDFRGLGCTDVRYLPFGYDEDLFAAVEPAAATPVHEVLFVGGADRDRVDFITSFMQTGPLPTLVGGYWGRYRQTRSCDAGHKDADSLRALTTSAAVNLCLVRRANRDGHVMRSFEIPAVGGFMLAEDTDEHRTVFGPDGQCVLYFTHARDAATKARWAIDHPAERRRMARAAHALVTTGGHTYRHRLQEMLAIDAQ